MCGVFLLKDADLFHENSKRVQKSPKGFLVMYRRGDPNSAVPCQALVEETVLATEQSEFSGKTYFTGNLGTLYFLID